VGVCAPFCPPAKRKSSGSTSGGRASGRRLGSALIQDWARKRAPLTSVTAYPNSRNWVAAVRSAWSAASDGTTPHGLVRDLSVLSTPVRVADRVLSSPDSHLVAAPRGCQPGAVDDGNLLPGQKRDQTRWRKLASEAPTADFDLAGHTRYELRDIQC